jgi:hypothetical protein
MSNTQSLLEKIEYQNWTILHNVKNEQGESDLYFELQNAIMPYCDPSESRIARNRIISVLENWDYEIEDYINPIA